MSVTLIRVAGDFAVARPIPWDEDDTLRKHLDLVIDALTTSERVLEVDTLAELDEGKVKVAIVLAGVEEDGADRIGRETLAASIRECNARHFQLLTSEEEAALSTNLPSRSGLLTPLWRLRTLSVEPVSGA